MEMHLRATRDMQVKIGGALIPFAASETIHTESSRKFTRESVTAMAETAGWRVVSFEQSPEPSVALVLLAA